MNEKGYKTEWIILLNSMEIRKHVYQGTLQDNDI